jgi:hypothetical protein
VSAFTVTNINEALACIAEAMKEIINPAPHSLPGPA